METKYNILPVKDFEGIYEVYDDGDIKSIDRQVIDKRGFSNTRGGKILRPGDNGTGYKFVQLWKENKPYRRYVHVIVAEAFVPNPENKPKVNHKDTNKANNHAINLEWVTESENMFHSYANNCHKAGEKHPNSKLSDISRVEILKDYATNDLGRTNTARWYNVTSTILARLIQKQIDNYPNDDLTIKLIAKSTRKLKR
jgi:hypothetical protein